jgi:alkanesulfonate monooxygenase SsuD/methylene tetrahydromethanopterin reductase-like flavin-dependent oxidoreductase (luciferase family)
MELLKKLWIAEDPFDFEGQFYKVTKVESQPKPIQQLPAVMNAGTSPQGMRFAAKYADMVFTHLQEDLDDVRRLTAECKRLAFEEFGRSVQVWTHGYIVVRDTEAEAQEFLRYYAEEKADHASVAAFTRALDDSADDRVRSEAAWKFRRNWAAGGGIALVGTGEQVARRMVELSHAGLDGILLNSIEPENMLEHVIRSVIPRLEQAGVRRPRQASKV